MDDQGAQDLTKASGRPAGRMTGLDRFACVLPIGLISAMLAIYFIDRDFYLAYIIEPLRREYQAVEILTFCFLLVSVLMLAVATRNQWRRRQEPGGTLALIVICLMLGATFFAFGEEVDWGDTFFRWTDEGGELENVYALNVHNNFSVKTLGSAFLIGVFFGLPYLWLDRKRWKLPVGFRPAVAEWPVVFAMAVAFGWRLVKSVYLMFVGKENVGVYGDNNFYQGFLEQTNEHKEMLIAAAIFLYAIYRISATRKPTTDKSSD